MTRRWRDSVRHGRSRDDGATSVEFALVLPLLVGMLGIGAYFGWSTYVQAQIDRSASRAARFASVPTNAGVWAFCRDQVLAAVNDDLTGSTVPDSELTLTDDSGNAPATCTDVATYRQPVGRVQVKVGHVYTNPFSGIVSTLTPLSGSATVVGSGSNRVEAP